MLDKKIEAALEAFQDASDRRMADANAAEEPRQPLFHYTTEAALFSILDSGQFWFTSIYHMDDPEELNFGFNVARELFKEATARSKGLARGFCRELGLEGELEKIKELMAVYSVSFGLRNDKQQWMDYADRGRGVAFGLAPKFFGPVPFENPENPKPEEIIFYGKVTYGRADARTRHSKVVEAALAFIEHVQRRKWLRSGEEAAIMCRKLASSMYAEILWNSVTTKDNHWSHQNEWRLLVRNFLKDPELPIISAETRPRVDITQPRLKASLIEVMVGPNADSATSERVRGALAARGLQTVPVTHA